MDVEVKEEEVGERERRRQPIWGEMDIRGPSLVKRMRGEGQAGRVEGRRPNRRRFWGERGVVETAVAQERPLHFARQHIMAEVGVECVRALVVLGTKVW